MLADNAVLALLRLRVIQPRVLAVNALFFAMHEPLPHFRGLKQGLGGDAAHQQTRSAEPGLLLDERRLQSVLAGANGGRVSPRAASDDNEIVRHFNYSTRVTGGSAGASTIEEMRWLLLLLMIAVAPGFGQTQTPPTPKKAPAKTTPAKKAPAKAASPAPPPTSWPIRSFAVEGAPDYTRDQVLAASGLALGQVAGTVEFDAAYDRLLATGAFETVSYRFDPGSDGNIAAVFELTETGPILPMQFLDLSVPDADLMNVFKSNDPLFLPSKLPANAKVIDRYIQWTQEYLASKGVPQKVAADVTPWPDELTILFRPAKSFPVVAEVTFEGNRLVPQSALREAVAGAAVGAAYTEVGFRQILDSSVRPVYEARGRVRVAFTSLRTEPATDVIGVRVFVTVDEGESYKLAQVDVTGVPPTFAAAELLKIGEFQTGDVANFDRINQGLASIGKELRLAGYLDNRVSADRDIRDAEKVVGLVVRVESGVRYLMGKLNITGLDLTAEAEIRRIWSLKEGQPFNPDYPESFLSGVRTEGLFDNLGATEATTKKNEAKATVDVTLTFAGAAPDKTKPAFRGRGGR